MSMTGPIISSSTATSSPRKCPFLIPFPRARRTVMTFGRISRSTRKTFIMRPWSSMGLAGPMTVMMAQTMGIYSSMAVVLLLAPCTRVWSGSSLCLTGRVAFEAPLHRRAGGMAGCKARSLLQGVWPVLWLSQVLPNTHGLSQKSKIGFMGSAPQNPNIGLWVQCRNCMTTGMRRCTIRANHVTSKSTVFAVVYPHFAQAVCTNGLHKVELTLSRLLGMNYHTMAFVNTLSVCTLEVRINISQCKRATVK